MTDGFPWFPMYPRLWLSSDGVELLTLEEEGAYVRLMCRAWLNDDCGLDDDDEILAKLSRLGLKKWAKSGPRLRRHFQARDGRLYNPTLLKIRDQQVAKSQKAAESATRGWRQRGVVKTQHTDEQNAMRTQCERIARASESRSLERSDSESQRRREFPDHEIFAMSETLSEYFCGRLGYPDDVIVRQCLIAAGQASIEEIRAFLKDRRLNGQSPDDPSGPRTWKWFPPVLHTHFSARRAN